MAAAPGVEDSRFWTLMRRKKKVLYKDPNRSESGDAATSGKCTEPFSAQQEGDYDVGPTFNISTISIALLQVKSRPVTLCPVRICEF